jgi:vibriolysin
MDDETEQPTDLVEAPKTTARRLQEEPPVASLETYDCQQGTICNVLSSNSPKAIATGDLAVDSAHNFALATWEYYNTTHGRDSIDGNGMTLKSRVHYGQNYNNAFWNGVQMTYGDGDGVYFAPLSQDADVVGHELTHGITERTSGLIYAGESGGKFDCKIVRVAQTILTLYFLLDSSALNEAWSDIFGAMVDVFTGATGADIWRIGEDIYTPKIPGDALRFMNDPALAGDYDWYPTRYMCGGDNGGVHWNSGIANLAFVLLSDGGKHPRDKSSVVVTGIGMERAAEVFYAANFCLTANSGFYMARYCTAAAAGSLLGGSYASAVHLAWDAVGVPAELPVIPEPIEISDNVSLEGLAGPKGEIQQYYLLVGLGETVTCTTSGNNGDADLYLRFGAKAEAHPDSRVNECGSYTPESNEACTTGAASSVGTTLYAAIHAYDCYNNLILTCTVNAPSSGCTKGAFRDSCTVNADCCSNNCGGNPRNRKCKN